MQFKTTLIAATLGAFVLTGCTNPDGTTNSTQTGATLGAIGGGIVGAAAGNSGLQTAVGAGIGAAIGGAVGSTLDAQAADLRQNVNNPNVGIVNTGSELLVTLPEAITFATDSAVLSISAQRDIAALAQNLLKYPNSLVRVVGHTDSTGPLQHNMDLSQRRAQSVANVLTNNAVPARRIATSGVGPTQPVASNATVEGRAANRRVEITIRPTQ